MLSKCTGTLLLKIVCFGGQRHQRERINGTKLDGGLFKKLIKKPVLGGIPLNQAPGDGTLEFLKLYLVLQND